MRVGQSGEAEMVTAGVTNAVCCCLQPRRCWLHFALWKQPGDVTACALLCRSWVLSRSEDAGSWPLPALLPRLWFGSSRIKPFPVLDLGPAELWQCSARTSKSKIGRLARTFWFSETFGKTQSLQTLGHFSFKKVKL